MSKKFHLTILIIFEALFKIVAILIISLALVVIILIILALCTQDWSS